MKTNIFLGFIMAMAGCATKPEGSTTAPPIVHIASNGIVSLRHELTQTDNAGSALLANGIQTDIMIRVEAEAGTLHKDIKKCLKEIEDAGYKRARFYQIEE